MSYYNRMQGRGNNNPADQDPMMKVPISISPARFNCSDSGELNFTTTDEGLVDVVRELHSDLCMRSPNYREQISESMLLYYATIQLWCRKAHVAHRNFSLGQSPHEEVQNFVRTTQLSCDRYDNVPKLLSIYYSGIGNITDPFGNFYIWNNVTWPDPEVYEGVSGYFGQVNHDTHVHYMNQLSPGVVAQRILEEIAYSNNKDLTNAWDLPTQLRPTDENAGLPTPNLLGYQRIQERLTDEQLRLLKDCGVIISSNGQRSFGKISNHTFCFNTDLYNRIGSVVHGTIHCLRIKKGKLTTKETGSLSQIPFVTCSEIDNTRALKSSFDFPSEISVASMAFRYRSEKISRGNTAKWAIYDFQNYNQVPADWRQTSNNYFTHGKPDVWNNGTKEADIQYRILHLIMTKVVTNEAVFLDSDSD